MGKLEKKIELVKNYLPKCNSVYNCYTYGKIPKDKFNNACTNYAGYVAYENVLGLIDETVFDSGKKGMLFAENGVYVSGMQSIIRYADGYKFKSLPSSYNITALNELMQKLYEVETAITGWDIAGSLFGAVLEGVVSALVEDDENEEMTEKNNSEADVVYDMPEDEEIFEMDDLSADEWKDVLSSAQEYVDSLETLLCDALTSGEDEFTANIKNILREMEECRGGEAALDKVMLAEIENGNQLEIQEIHFSKESRKYVNKMKLFISIAEDIDEDDTEEISDAKKAIRKYVKVLEVVSDNLEKIIEAGVHRSSEKEKDNSEENSGKLLKYIKESGELVQYLKDTPRSWLPIHGELNSEESRREYAQKMNLVKSTLNGETYIYNEICQSIHNITYFMQSILAKYPSMCPMIDDIEPDKFGSVVLPILDEEGDLVEKKLSLEGAFVESVKNLLRAEQEMELDDEFIYMYDAGYDECIPFGRGLSLWGTFDIMVSVFQTFVDKLIEELQRSDINKGTEFLELSEKYPVNFDDAKREEYDVVLKNDFRVENRPYITISSPDLYISECNYVKGLGFTKNAKLHVRIHNRELLEEDICFEYEEIRNEKVFGYGTCCEISWGEWIDDCCIELLIEELEQLRDLKIKIYLEEDYEIVGYIEG